MAPCLAFRVRLWGVLSLLPLLAGCEKYAGKGQANASAVEVRREVGAGSAAAAHGGSRPERTAAESRTCDARIQELRAEPRLPGAPDFEANRSAILLRAKGEPVLFLDEPRFTPVSSKGMTAQRARLLGPRSREATHELARKFRGRPAEMRQLFLRQGYLFSNDPGAARELATLSVEDLFQEPRLRLERGGEQWVLNKDKSKYVYGSGPQQGERAQLLFLDRIWVEGEEPGPRLHVELREVVERGSMQQLAVEWLTASGLVAMARYGDVWVESLFRIDGARLHLECQSVPPDQLAHIGAARDRAYRSAAVVRQLRRAIVRQVAAGLPFDEPKTEVGQQDGELRQRWEDAYFSGAERYRFNSDSYSVFDSRGQPLTPQVCVDFVTETLERASGMHYAPHGMTPEKIRGSLDFDELLQGQRRREHALRAYAHEHPEQFQILDYPPNDAVKYERQATFFRFLSDNARDFAAGDVVIIRGRAAWDHYEAIHSHAFFVYETDPITGAPLLLAGNSGVPKIVTWDAEMQRAPKRSVQHRIRPNLEWLYDHVVLREPSADERWATPLSVFHDG